ALERATIRSSLLHNLSEVHRLVPRGSREEAALREAQQAVMAYLDRARLASNAETTETYLTNASEALQRLVDENVAQADETLKEAARWDVLAERIGFGGATMLLLASAALLLWLRFYAFRSVLELRDAIGRFPGRMEQVRAPESGPEELKNIAKQFNQMAEA